jgi:ribosome recycling factor
MNEEVEMYIEMTKENMDNSIIHLKNELIKIRAGKASPGMLDGIFVDYYGVNTPLNQVANVGTTDARTIMIQPWEKSMIEPIEKAIMKANLGFNPVNNGELIRINVPVLTEERRLNLVRQVKNEGENAKISIRNSRRETNDEIKKLKKEGLSEDVAKDAEKEVQELTDTYVKKIDEFLEIKEKDIMTI